MQTTPDHQLELGRTSSWISFGTEADFIIEDQTPQTYSRLPTLPAVSSNTFRDVKLTFCLAGIHIHGARQAYN